MSSVDAALKSKLLRDTIYEDLILLAAQNKLNSMERPKNMLL